MIVAVNLDCCAFYVKIRIWPYLGRITGLNHIKPGDDNDLQEVDFIEKLVHDQFQTTSSEIEIDESNDLQMIYF